MSDETQSTAMESTMEENTEEQKKVDGESENKSNDDQETSKVENEEKEDETNELENKTNEESETQKSVGESAENEEKREDDSASPSNKEESKENKGESDEKKEEGETAANEDESKDQAEEENEDEGKEKKKKKKKKKDKEKKKKKKKQKEENAEEQEMIRDIFGESSDEEGQEVGAKDSAEIGDKDDISDVDIEQEAKETLKKLAKKRDKKRKKKNEDGEEKPRKKRARKETVEEGEGEAPMEDEEGGSRPKKEKDFFDQVLDNLKAGRARRRKDDQDEMAQQNVLDQLKAKMEIAYEDDKKANIEKQPALHKVKVLQEVVRTLEKKHLHSLLVQSDEILVMIRKWLEPLPDGSLVNMKIRESMLQLLLQFPDVDMDILKESGVGKVVMFLWKNPTETAQNKKLAKTLIEKWSRPIFGLSSHYKDLQYAEEEEVTKRREQKNRESSSKPAVDLDTELESRVKSVSRNSTKDSPTAHARIPERAEMEFKIRPKSQISADEIRRRPKHKLEKQFFGKKPGAVGAGKAQRAVSLSIEGRNMNLG